MHFNNCRRDGEHVKYSPLCFSLPGPETAKGETRFEPNDTQAKPMQRVPNYDRRRQLGIAADVEKRLRGKAFTTPIISTTRESSNIAAIVDVRIAAGSESVLQEVNRTAVRVRLLIGGGEIDGGHGYKAMVFPREMILI